MTNRTSFKTSNSTTRFTDAAARPGTLPAPTGVGKRPPLAPTKIEGVSEKTPRHKGAFARSRSGVQTLEREARAVLASSSPLPRIAMISTHGYVAATPPLGAADTGGQVVYVIELSKKLAQLGYEVDIWTRRFEDQSELECVNERVRIIRMPCGGPRFIRKEDLVEHLPEWNKHAARFIARHALSYKFVNSHYWDAGVAGQVLAEKLAVPHVHTPHSLGVWKQQQMKTDFRGSAAEFEHRYNFTRRNSEERRLYATCDLVIATTPQQLDLIVRDYEIPSAKVRMIPPGYDDHRFFPLGDGARMGIRRRLGFTGKAVLAIGRLARNKGYDLLIDSFSVLAPRRADAVLHLAVGGANLNPQEKALLAELHRRAEKTGFADRIRFLPFIPDEQLPDYYRAADLFVLSSRYEPFGMTAIEAMACGTPTIVTVHGGLYRALSFGRHALFADPFDCADLGITMAKVFRHSGLRKRMGRMGAHKARSLFTWSGIAQQILTAIDQRGAPVAVFEDNDWDEPWNDGD